MGVTLSKYLFMCFVQISRWVCELSVVQLRFSSWAVLFNGGGTQLFLVHLVHIIKKHDFLVWVAPGICEGYVPPPPPIVATPLVK